MSNTRLSHFIALLKGVLSTILGGLFHVVDKLSESKDTKPAQLNWIIPLLITIVLSILFYTIYSSSNPMLRWVIAQIDLSFIDFGFLGFTLLSVFLLLGMLNPIDLKDLEIEDLKASNNLVRTKRKVDTGIKGLFMERRIGVFLFIGLSITLLYVNIIDLVVLLGGFLPEGMTYADFLHQGFWSLVVSVVLSIIIVLYFFRNELNFVRNNQKLKTVAYLWMAMNFILILTTISKNTIYVAEYGLTYKRILVYAFLLLTLGGIIITYSKIYATKSTWYFSRNTFGVGLVVLFLSSLSPWDKIITNYNLFQGNTIDMEYLCHLENNKLQLLQYMDKETKEFTYEQIEKVRLHAQIKQDNYLEKGWQSTSLTSIQLTDYFTK